MMSITMNSKDGWVTLNTINGSMTMNAVNGSMTTIFEPSNKGTFGVNSIVKLALIALSAVLTIDLGLQCYFLFKERSFHTKFLLSETQTTNDPKSVQKSERILTELDIILDRQLRLQNTNGLYGNSDYRLENGVWKGDEVIKTEETDQNAIVARFSKAVNTTLINSIKNEYIRELNCKTGRLVARFAVSFFLLSGLVAHSLHK